MKVNVNMVFPLKFDEKVVWQKCPLCEKNVYIFHISSSVNYFSHLLKIYVKMILFSVGPKYWHAFDQKMWR